MSELPSVFLPISYFLEMNRPALYGTRLNQLTAEQTPKCTDTHGNSAFSKSKTSAIGE